MKKDNEKNRLNKLFEIASSARTNIDTFRNNWEEFYYNDVDQTKSQFTYEQAEEIKKTYNINLSTKISYPIIEQMLSFLTGTKPFPKLLSATHKDMMTIHAYQEAYKAVWYDSKINRVLYNVFRDMFVVGSGFIKVRKNDFFDETSMNVKAEYIRWKHIYIDPQCRNSDLSDAEYIVHAFPMPKSKAEKKYDVKLDEQHLDDWEGYAPEDDDAGLSDYYSDEGNDKATVTIKEFYEKEEKSVYISENGDVSLKRPKPILLPNPVKIELAQQIEQITQQIIELSTIQEQQQVQVNDINQLAPNIPGDQPMQNFMQEQGARMSNEESQISLEELQVGLQELQTLYGQEPDKLPGYEMINERDEKVQVYEIIRTVKKRIKKTFMVGSKILESEYLPFENYPILGFFFQHAGIINKTYGMMHYILDMQKFLNKTYSMLIYDMQTNNRPRILVAKGSIINKKLFEDAWSQPGGIIEYEALPNLPDQGKPQVLSPMPLSQVTTYVIQEMQRLTEYVSGVHGVTMGDSGSAPSTAGATASLQNFGTQRVKMYARSIEPVLEQLAIVILEHIQQYSPKDKHLDYIDENHQEHVFEILQTKDDIKFKVRIDIVNDLPTVKQQLATTLASVAGQTQNPYVADSLIKLMLKSMDNPEYTELAENIDAIKQLEQQNQQLQEQLKQIGGQLKAMEHNNAMKESKHKVESLVKDAKVEIDSNVKELENMKDNTNNTNIDLDTLGGF